VIHCVVVGCPTGNLDLGFTHRPLEITTMAGARSCFVSRLFVCDTFGLQEPVLHRQLTDITARVWQQQKCYDHWTCQVTHTHCSKIVEHVVSRSWLDHWFVQPASEFCDYLRYSGNSVGKNHMELVPSSFAFSHRACDTHRTLAEIANPRCVSS
jgi:hypothetical protein